MPDDRTINGPGAGSKPKKPKPPSVFEKRNALQARIAQANAAPAIAIEQTVQQAAAKLELTHERIMRSLIEIAEHPYMRGSERVAALAQLADILGTKKQPQSNHLHLHGVLASVSDDRLEDRIATLLKDASA